MEFENLDDALEHYGIKGMHWGQRHDRGHEGSRARLSKISKLDKAFEKAPDNIKLAHRVQSEATSRFNELDLPKINKDPRFAGKELRSGSLLTNQYIGVMNIALSKRIDDVVHSLGTNASGTKNYEARFHDNGSWFIQTKDVKHANDEKPEILFVIEPTFDELGRVISIKMVKPLSHSMILDDALKHYGVKGMHWGIRKAAGSRPSGRKSKTSNKTIYKKKAKRLSDKELEKRVKRLQMEKKYNELNAADVSEGRKLASKIMKDSGDTIAKAILPAVGIYVIKKAIKKKHPELAKTIK